MLSNRSFSLELFECTSHTKVGGCLLLCLFTINFSIADPISHKLESQKNNWSYHLSPCFENIIGLKSYPTATKASSFKNNTFKNGKFGNNNVCKAFDSHSTTFNELSCPTNANLVPAGENWTSWTHPLQDHSASTSPNSPFFSSL